MINGYFYFSMMIRIIRKMLGPGTCCADGRPSCIACSAHPGKGNEEKTQQQYVMEKVPAHCYKYNKIGTDDGGQMTGKRVARIF